jgi:hypothetical protein
VYDSESTFSDDVTYPSRRAAFRRAAGPVASLHDHCSDGDERRRQSAGGGDGGGGGRSSSECALLRCSFAAVQGRRAAAVRRATDDGARLRTAARCGRAASRPDTGQAAGEAAPQYV